MPETEIKYKSWRDRGGNFGVQCLDCNKVHWTGEESAIDTSTGKPCENCISIKTSNLRNEAAIEHQVEISDLPIKQEEIIAKNKIELDITKHLKVPELEDVCQHHISQPIELR